ncbi:hypothetical protein L6452_09551 [Arctium lappa]|uniref:Uncharacterized protein n=1 Tax=Arctium lappa TaxID=4217 RepID=A0ACB9DKT4_ARCLA|nr:hypothetical protein L6452_09551 [Arctium lappa]
MGSRKVIGVGRNTRGTILMEWGDKSKYNNKGTKVTGIQKKKREERAGVKSTTENSSEKLKVIGGDLERSEEVEVSSAMVDNVQNKNSKMGCEGSKDQSHDQASNGAKAGNITGKVFNGMGLEDDGLCSANSEFSKQENLVGDREAVIKTTVGCCSITWLSSEVSRRKGECAAGGSKPLPLSASYCRKLRNIRLLFEGWIIAAQSCSDTDPCGSVLGRGFVQPLFCSLRCLMALLYCGSLRGVW